MRRLIIFCALFFLKSGVAFDFCPPDLGQLLYDNLRPKLSWVDVNVLPWKKNCELTIRYFPCQEPINAYLDQAFSQVLPACTHSVKKPISVEGYCELENIKIHCAQ